MNNLQQSLVGFTVERVLNDNPHIKTVNVLGHYGGLRAIAILERQPFVAGQIPQLLSDETKVTEKVFDNDIYTNYICSPPSTLNTILARFICPVTDAHITKYSAQEVHLVRETAELYKNISLPFIEAIPPSRISWVFNILEGTKEADRVLHNERDEATGFVLLPDLKWNQAETESLYCIAIVQNRSLRSIRDLTTEHLPLLRHVRDKGCAVIAEKFHIPSSQLRVFFHYHPSYYHLHIHFTHVRSDLFGTNVGKAHLLNDVIGNIEHDTAYYQGRTITCVLGADHPLCRPLLHAFP